MSTHVLLLIAEAALTGCIVLSLFGLRRRFGLAPVYLVVGAFQYLSIVLATTVRIEVLPGVIIDPASVVLFPITTIVVLLTYIELDAEETRKVAYGVVISNLAVYAVAAVAGWHLVLDGHRNPLDLPVTLFTQSLRLALVSTFALFVDVVTALVVFEAISRRLRASLFRRLWLTLAVVMAVDSVLFYGGVFFGRPGWLGMVAFSFFAKLAGATFYSAFVALYVRYIDPGGPGAAGDRTSRDIFTWLTYRQRYEEARVRLARDALTGLYNRGYFDELGPRQVAHAERAGHPMSLVVIDVDGLKAANDRHGHQAGDQLVRFVADQLTPDGAGLGCRLSLRRRRVRRRAHQCRRGRGADLRRAVPRARQGPLGGLEPAAAVGPGDGHGRHRHLPEGRPDGRGAHRLRRQPALPGQAWRRRPGRERRPVALSAGSVTETVSGAVLPATIAESCVGS